MAQLTASRTLVKSSPELWAECSDAASLARHLGAFGEIRITKLEPETAVAWEGEDVRGTVTLEPSGWGTRVVLTAELPTPAVGVGNPDGDVTAAPEREPITEPDPDAVGEPVPVVAAEPVAAAEPEPPAPAVAPNPVAAAEPEPVADAEPDLAAAAEPARPGFLRRLFGGWRRPAASASADSVAEPADDEANVTPAERAEPAEPAASTQAAAAPAVPAAHSAPSDALAAPPAPAPSAAPAEPDSPSAQALVGALDSLGRAHRRPFSHG